jgi:hypothetical protein
MLGAGFRGSVLASHEVALFSRAFVFLGLMALGPLIIHMWWLPRHGMAK